MFAETLEPETNTHQDALDVICQSLSELSSYSSDASDLMVSPLLKRIQRTMNEGQRLKFVLPAFPAKSPSRLKTTGVLPDLGEILALQNLNGLCQRISAVYAPGAEVLICSDGRIFSDVVGVDDETINQYQQGIEEIIAEFQLRHLGTFAMDDLFPELSPQELRDRVLWQFGKCAEEIRHQVLTNPDFTGLFNGIHKFMVEDRQGVTPEKSKNQINKETKPLTYELLRRSDAWSAVLDHYHRGALRLSIHPYPVEHEKFGVLLVPSSSKWATPWHNVTVKREGKFELMHLVEAERLGAKRKLLGGKYAYFEV